MQWFHSHPRIKNWLVLFILMTIILAVTSHASLPSLRQWLVFGGLTMVLATLCVWLLALARPLE